MAVVGHEEPYPLAPALRSTDGLEAVGPSDSSIRVHKQRLTKAENLPKAMAQIMATHRAWPAPEN